MWGLHTVQYFTYMSCSLISRLSALVHTVSCFMLKQYDGQAQDIPDVLQNACADLS